METNHSAKSRNLRKNRFRPKSFLGLVLIGFAFVVLPLIAALVYNAMRIDQLTILSRNTVYRATEITHGGRTLIDESMVMDRSIQQVLALDDTALLEGYLLGHNKFEATIKHMLDIVNHEKQHLLLEKIRILENSIFNQVLALDERPQILQTIPEQFAALLALTQQFSTSNFQLIGQSIERINETAAETRALVESELLILAPLVIFLALIFSFIIARPVRQIDQAISLMGEGTLTVPVRVTGPRNLAYLGDRLDWLRLRLLKLEEQKMQFFRHVSHELKTPLTSIREGSELLAGGVSGNLNAQQSRIASILHDNSLQLQHKIEELLSYSALREDMIKLVKQPVNLNKFITAAARAHRLSILRKQIKIYLLCPELSLKCDKQKLDVILDNLLSNAVKFTPDKGDIKISATCQKNEVQIDICDSGPGVDKADSNKIFEPFYQGRNLPSNRERGTGLGLAISKEYALAHGGNINLIQTTCLGASFRLTLPILLNMPAPIVIRNTNNFKLLLSFLPVILLAGCGILELKTRIPETTSASSPVIIESPSHLRELMSYFTYLQNKTAPELALEYDYALSHYRNSTDSQERFKFLILLLQVDTKYFDTITAAKHLEQTKNNHMLSSDLLAFSNILDTLLQQQIAAKKEIQQLSTQLTASQAEIGVLQHKIDAIKNIERNLIRRNGSNAIKNNMR
ncbi:MAG: HAMP domain-containing sensor histidine kinase [Nitrosomonas sp.]|nr:HAMP domain-containing sensor histidine kinase [Nitrosomonas sp.]